MTKFNLDTPILDLSDNPMKESELVVDENGKKTLKVTERNVTYKTLFVNSLFNPAVKEGKKFEQTLDDYELGMRLRKGGEVDLDHGDITRILECVDHSHDIFTRGRAHDFLDITVKEEPK